MYSLVRYDAPKARVRRLTEEAFLLRNLSSGFLPAVAYRLLLLLLR